MGDMADYALDGLGDEDEAQLRTLGTSNVFGWNPLPLSEEDEQRMSGDLPALDEPEVMP